MHRGSAKAVVHKGLDTLNDRKEVIKGSLHKANVWEGNKREGESLKGP